MRPAQGLLWLLLAWSLAAVVPIGWPEALPAWLLLGGALLAAAVFDARAARPAPQVRRDGPPVLALGSWSQIELTLDNPGARALTLLVFDHHPQPAEVDGLPLRVTLPPGARARARYRLRPLRRGDRRYGRVQLLVESPLALWQHSLFAGVGETVRVLPNFAAVAHFALLAHDRRRGLMGIHLRRRRGEGSAFFQLREYRDGDSQRQIDWKATARHRKLISKEYQDEQDQRVVFLLDCSRRLRASDGEFSHFDHVLNALILLAHVALRQGDAVGLQCFGGEQRRVDARKGPGVLPRLLDAVYDLQPTLSGADYAAAGSLLLQQQRKRALVVVLTNLRDEDSDELVPTLALLRRRHLVLLANLREAVLDDALRRPDDLAAARLYTATCHYLNQRERVQQQLRHRGGDVIDAAPQTLPAALVNHYLTIKRSGRL